MLFFASIGAFVYAFVLAATRSANGDNIAVANLFFLQGSAPRDVQRNFLWMFVVCLVVAMATVVWTPFSFLVPMLPVGLAGMWAARYGTFPPRLPSDPPVDSCRGRRDARGDRGGRVTLDVLRDRGRLRGVPDVGHRCDVGRRASRVDDAGRATRVEYHASALGKAIRYVLDYDFADAPRRSRGRWSKATWCARSTAGTAFGAHDDGTLVEYDLHIDLAVPLPGMLKRAAAGRITTAALADLKRVAEGAGGAPGSGGAGGDGGSP